MMIGVEQGWVVLDRVGDGDGVAFDAGGMIVDIGLGDVDRAAERVLDLSREHGVKAKIEGHRRKDRDQNSGHYGDGAEPGDKTHMQPRAGAAGFSFRPKPHQPPGDQGAQRKAQSKVDEEKNDQSGVARRPRDQPRQGGVGNAARQDRQKPDHKRKARWQGSATYQIALAANERPV